MTETLVATEPGPVDFKAALAGWTETPPESVTAALAELDYDEGRLEQLIRSGMSTDDTETLRRVLIQSATRGNTQDATMLARLTPMLDPRERSWDRVLRAKANGDIVTATVTEATKGGVVVDLGVRGFVPSSQLGLNVPKSLQQYVGRPLKLRVVEVDRRRGTVILSNRSVMEEERAVRRRAAMEKLTEGEDRQGAVRRITDIGAFVDVGGIDGLLHVSEISWRRIEHPSEVLEVGQKVNVRILRLDPQGERVSLSMRRLVPDPWEVARDKYHVGDVLNVKITKLIPQGAVAMLDEENEAFIPISELATKRVAAPDEVVQVDQEVEATIIEMHPRDRRIVLSLRKKEQRAERPGRDQQQQQQQPQQQQPRQQQNRGSDRTTLGDLFGHLFAELRMDQDESNGKHAQDNSPAAETPAPPIEAAAAEAQTEPEVPDAPQADEALEVDIPPAADGVATAEDAPIEDATQSVSEASGEDAGSDEVADADEPATVDEAPTPDAEAEEAEPKPEDGEV